MDKFAILLENINAYELMCFSEKIYGPYSRSDGRQIVIVKDDSGKTKTISYPKYIMEQHLNRPLDENLETVDHINFDKNDNRIENLRLVPRSEHSADDTRRVKLVKFRCSLCDKEFERSPRLVRDKAKKGRTGIFCGRQCAGKYSRKLQLNQMDRLPVQPFISSEYYRKKNIQATSNYLSEKYKI